MGTVALFGGNFAVGIPTDGRLMSIAENPALYSLYGTTYGGNGVTYFSLPDLLRCNDVLGQSSYERR